MVVENGQFPSMRWERSSDGLHFKAWKLSVEDCHDSLALAWGVSGKYIAPRRVTHVDDVRDLSLLEEPRIHVCLFHPM